MTHTSSCTAITFLNFFHKQTHVRVASLFFAIGPGWVLKCISMSDTRIYLTQKYNLSVDNECKCQTLSLMVL